VGSGTAALHLALLALGVGPGDEVIMPSYVCTALLNAVHYTGADPVIADIDSLTLNMDPEDTRRRITPRTRAIIVPHMFGMPARMEQFCRFDVPVIEDCAQSLGSNYRGKPLGSFGAAAIFSFYATKVITSGEGGMVISRSKKLIDRVVDLRQYDNRPRYEMRFNYKMTDISAAIGSSQLSSLPGFIQTRRRLAKKYRQAFASLGLGMPPAHPGHIYYRFVLDVGAEIEAWIKTLHEKGIACARPVYRPLHRYLHLEGFDASETAWDRSLSIPIYPSLSEVETDRVIAAILETKEALM
jgi:perosamine synthetase